MLDRIFNFNKIQNTINNFSDDTKRKYYSYLINRFINKKELYLCNY